MKYLLATSLLLSCASIFAQDFKEGMIFDVCGPVKEIVLNKENIFRIKKINFHQDGKIEGSIMNFDDNGMPVGWSVDIGENCQISYNMTHDKKRIISTIMDYSVMGNDWKLETEYIYDENSVSNNPIGMRLLETMNGDITSKEYQYSKYENDSHGNWTSRNVIETVVAANNAGNKDTKEYLETRTISYYK